MIELRKNAQLVPYFSFDGNIVGHLSLPQFFNNSVVGLPNKTGSNTKEAFITFDTYTTANKTYHNSSSVVQIADAILYPSKHKATYLIKGLKGVPISFGMMRGVSIVLAARLDEFAVGRLFILDSVMKIKPLNLKLNSLDFSLSNPG